MKVCKFLFLNLLIKTLFESQFRQSICKITVQYFGKIEEKLTANHQRNYSDLVYTERKEYFMHLRVSYIFYFHSSTISQLIFL